MIRTIADLLDEFRKREVQLLDEKNIPHSPTIGDMYEGLTRNILSKTLPAELDLRVTSGFVLSEDGKWSKQIDCMLVEGKGEIIPHTQDHIYRLENVIAVIEVKKNLYSQELLGAYNNLLSVHKLLKRKKFPQNRLFVDAYKTILRSEPYGKNLADLPFWEREIGVSLFLDSLLPVRVVLGYHGFRTEEKFRMAFAKLFESMVKEDMSGASSIPNLMISDKYSLVKTNGMPYSAPISTSDLSWHLMASYSHNPMIILLELIYTKIAYRYGVGDPDIEADLEVEILKPLLSNRVIEQNGKQKWRYEISLISEEELQKAPAFEYWEPVELNNEHFVLLTEIIDKENNEETVDLGISLDDTGLITWFENNGYDFEKSVSYLYDNNLIFKDNGRIGLLTKECKAVFLPDGRLVAGDDASGRLTNWVNQFMEEFRKGSSTVDEELL